MSFSKLHPPRHESHGRIRFVRSPIVLASVATLLLFIAPAAYWLRANADNDHQIKHEVRHAAERLDALVTTRLKSAEVVLRGIRGFVEGSDHVSAEEFATFIASLDVQASAPGVEAVSYIFPVGQGFADVPGSSGQSHSGQSQTGEVSTGESRYSSFTVDISTMQTPWSYGGLASLRQGLAARSMSEEGGLKDAADRARNSESFALSSKSLLVGPGSSEGTVEVAMYWPILLGPQSQTSADRNAAAFGGWAEARINLDRLLVPPEPITERGIELLFFVGEEASGETFLFGSLNGQRVDWAGKAVNPLSMTGTSTVSGQQWTYVVSPTRAFVREHTPQTHHLVLALGFLLSLAGGAIVWLMVTSRDRATLQAAHITRHLQAVSSDLEGTLNAVPDLLFELDSQGRVLGVRAHEKISALPDNTEEILGRTVHDLLPGEAANTYMDAVAAAGFAGVSTGSQINIPYKGEEHWFELSVAKKNDSYDGLRFIALARDINERHAAVKRIEESEHVLQESQRIAKIGHFWVDPLRKLWIGSPVACEILSIPSKENHPLDQIVKFTSSRHAESLLDFFLSDHPSIAPIEVPIRVVERSAEIWIQLNRQAIVGGEKDAATPKKLLFTVQDITERRKSSEQLTLLQKAVDSLNDMVLITQAEPFEEPGPKIVFANKALEAATGYSLTEVLGQTPRIFQGPGTSQIEIQRIGKALRGWQPILCEVLNYRKDGTPYWVELNIQPLADESGWYTHWVSVQRDVTERRAAQEKVHELAFYDTLTKLPNRSMFMVEAEKLLSDSDQRSSFIGAILLDLDNFKSINDSWGHRRGDEMLLRVVDRLRQVLDPKDYLARLGGDEFIVLMKRPQDVKADPASLLEALCRKILSGISRSMVLSGNEHFTTASIGGLLFPEGEISAEDLLSQVDSALNSAKKSGRNSYKLFDAVLKSQIAVKAALETDLRLSIQRKEIYLAYQCQVDDKGNVIGAEALCRWQHASMGSVSPALFIPLSEEIGFIQDLGPWVLEKAGLFLSSWRERTKMRDMTMSVNVSAQQFHHPDFVRQVYDAMNRSGLDPSLLKLELTESIFANDLDDIVRKMISLKAAGVKFSLDDFGTGYSSLSYLKKLPLDQLKIDQSFVRDALKNRHDESIAKTVIALGNDLGLQVIGEGVESQQQLDFLRSHGCRYFQGYLFGRPVREEEFIRGIDAAFV